MKAKLATAIAALDRLVNYFIPADIAADRDTRNRAHVFLRQPYPWPVHRKRRSDRDLSSSTRARI